MKKTFLRVISIVSTLAILIATVAVPASALTKYADVGDTVRKEIYLYIDGIQGESQDSKHEQWIDLLEFKHASVQSVQTGSPDAAGRGVFEPVVFKHYVDKATPKFQEATMKGSHIKTAEIHFCKAICGKQEVVYKVRLDGIKIVKAEVSAEDLPDGTYQLVETVTLLCNKQTWSETAVGLDNALGGNTEASFDQSKKASMFDSNTSIALTVAVAVIFVLLVVIVILFVSKKKNAVPTVSAEEK